MFFFTLSEIIIIVQIAFSPIYLKFSFFAINILHLIFSHLLISSDKHNNDIMIKILHQIGEIICSLLTLRNNRIVEL